MRKLNALALALLMTASFGSVALAQAQPADPAAPVTTVDRGVDRRDRGFDFGWLGLLGLMGLMGLRRRETNTIRTTHTAASAAR